MARKYIDCRDYPGPCTLAIAGEEEEVVQAQAEHLASAHSMEDTPELRSYIRSVLKEESAALSSRARA